MLIERKLPVSEFGELNLSQRYKIVYLHGSPEERRSQISYPENSVLLRNLNFQNPKENSLLLKLSFDGLIDPMWFKGLDYACFFPDICQFIPHSDESKLPYISLIKLSSWINFNDKKNSNCACYLKDKTNKGSYCPTTTALDYSGITFGIYFPLTKKECKGLQNLKEPILPMVGVSFIPHD